MIDEINNLISDVSYKMNYEACDYVMSMKLFPAQVSKGNVEVIVQSTFADKVSVSEVRPATGQQVVDSVKFALTHYEDETPLPYMQTAEHKDGSSLVRKFFASILLGSHDIYKFTLSDNHPFDPIMWDFAYCITLKEGDAVVLVASASD
jgi:hypothetical protein